MRVAKMTKKMNNRTALVTGATGFVGSHLVRRLIKEGRETHIITRSSSNLTLLKDVRKKVIIHQHDGTTNSMINIVKETEPEIIFHLASLFLAQHESKDIERLVQNNVLFGTQLAESMSVNNVNNLINTGTSWQHYQNEDYNPVCLYAATKQAFEDIIQYYVETSEIKAVTLKLYDTYGSDDPRPRLFSLLNKAAETGEPLDLSTGEQLIDFVYIDDVTEAYVIAAQRLLEGAVSQHERYAVSSGHPMQLKKLVKLYVEVTKQAVSVNWGGRPYRYREVMVPWSKGRSLPGWEPETNLIDGIRKACRQDLG